MTMQIIPKEKFTFAFEKLGWDNYVSEDGKYIVWTFRQNPDIIWTLVPRDERAGGYMKYQEQNIELILYCLDLEPTQENIDKIYQQLLGLHYPIISRVVNKIGDFDNGIPVNLAKSLLDKISKSYLDFRKNIEKKSINNLRFPHTQQGSFILKILVPTAEEKGLDMDVDSYFNQDQTTISEYLKQIDFLGKIETVDAKKYANKLKDNGIDTLLVKDLLNKDGLIETIQNYIDTRDIDDVYLKSENNQLLEFNKKTDINFNKNIVDLRNLKPLRQDFIQEIEELDKKSKIDETNVEIIATVFQINKNGTATFDLETINNQKPKFKKARSMQLTEARIKLCSNALPENEKIKITGDIKKDEGQGIAEIIIDSLSIHKDKNILF